MRTETVTRVRAGTSTDPYSNQDAESWEPGDVDTEDITTLAPAEPRPSSEPVQDARNAITSGFTLYLPSDADVTARDRMTVRGITYPVLGEPALWLGGGLVVQVGREEG